MTKITKQIIYLICNYICFAYTSNLEYDGTIQIVLQHNVNGLINPLFTDRGNISISSIRLGTYTINQSPLATNDATQIQKLGERNEIYQLKSIVRTSESINEFISNVKACMLAESHLTDILSVQLDYTGRVITVTELVSSTSTCEGAIVPVSKLSEFTTTVHVRHTYSGPSPDTATYIQKLEREREAKERGDVKDNRSFIAKYWMYIIPVVVIMVLSSNANPDQAAGNR